MREQLIELIDEFRQMDAQNDGRSWSDHLADYLIAEGVIVPCCKAGDTTMNNHIEEMAKCCTYYTNGECFVCADHPEDFDLKCDWKRHYESLYETAKATIRAEVAREIFEEIEDKVKYLTRCHLEELNKEYNIGTPLYDRHSGIVFALRGIDDFIAELKKKYGVT